MSSCSIQPAWLRIAHEQQLDVAWLETPAFRHLVISNAYAASHLRIYVEGDGTPWISEQRIALDPTPSNPLMLRMMAADEGPALYLGRPCYFGTATSKSCDPALWTARRYGAAVIKSMCEAANRLASERGVQSVELAGYSGGGAVVLAMRGCTQRLTAITTIAGNLDVNAWTTYHRYTPLLVYRDRDFVEDNSKSVSEIHWQCRDDETVPPAITDSYFAAHPAAQRRMVENCSHSNGWEQHLLRIISSDNQH